MYPYTLLWHWDVSVIHCMTLLFAKCNEVCSDLLQNHLYFARLTALHLNMYQIWLSQYHVCQSCVPRTIRFSLSRLVGIRLLMILILLTHCRYVRISVMNNIIAVLTCYYIRWYFWIECNSYCKITKVRVCNLSKLFKKMLSQSV
jgi:hypothetical protein